MVELRPQKNPQEKQLLNRAAYYSATYHQERMRELKQRGNRIGQFGSEFVEGIRGWRRANRIRKLMDFVGDTSAGDVVLSQEAVHQLIANKGKIDESALRKAQAVTKEYRAIKSGQQEAVLAAPDTHQLAEQEVALDKSLHPDLYALMAKRAAWTGLGYAKLAGGVALAASGIGLGVVPAYAASGALGIVANDNSIRFDEALYQSQKGTPDGPVKTTSTGLFNIGNVDLTKEHKSVLGQAIARAGTNVVVGGLASFGLGEGLHTLFQNVHIGEASAANTTLLPHDPPINDLHGHFAADVTTPAGTDLIKEPGTSNIYELVSSQNHNIVLANDIHIDSLNPQAIDAHWLVPMHDIHPGSTLPTSNGDMRIGTIINGKFDFNHTSNAPGGEWITQNPEQLVNLPHVVINNHMPAGFAVNDGTTIVSHTIDGITYGLVENTQTHEIIGAFNMHDLQGVNATSASTISGFHLLYYNLSGMHLSTGANDATIQNFITNGHAMNLSVGNDGADFATSYATNIASHALPTTPHAFWYTQTGSTGPPHEVDYLRHIIDMRNLPGEPNPPIPGQSGGGGIPGLGTQSILPGWYNAPGGGFNHPEHFDTQLGAAVDQIMPEWVANISDRVGDAILYPGQHNWTFLGGLSNLFTGLASDVNSVIPHIPFTPIQGPIHFPLDSVEHFNTWQAVAAHNFLPFGGDVETHGLVDPAGKLMGDNILGAGLAAGLGLGVHRLVTGKWGFAYGNEWDDHKGKVILAALADIALYHFFAPEVAAMAALAYLAPGYIGHLGGLRDVFGGVVNRVSGQGPIRIIQTPSTPETAAETGPAVTPAAAFATAFFPITLRSAMDGVASGDQQVAYQTLKGVQESLLLQNMSDPTIDTIINRFETNGALTEQELQQATAALQQVPRPSLATRQQVAASAMQQVQSLIAATNADTSLSDAEKQKRLTYLNNQVLYLQQLMS